MSKDFQHSLCTSGLTEHYINVGSPFQGGEDFRKCYLATDVDRLITEALRLAERLRALAELRTDEDALDLDEDWIAAQRFIEENGHD